MKTKLFLITLATFVISPVILAQAPDKLNYQAILRDAGGFVRADAPVSIAISILQGSATGTAIYTETHNATTNNLGLVNLQIGGGTPALGAFASIDWASGPYYVKISVDGTEFGTSQLVSVPYAKYAEKAGNGFSGNYADLTGKPSLFSGNYSDLSGKPSLFSGSYSDLAGKPSLAPVATSGSYTDLTNFPANLDTDQTNDVITSGNQTITGVKTFTGTVKADSLVLTKKTSKYVFNAHYCNAVGTELAVVSNNVTRISFEASGTPGDRIGYLYIPSLPYQILGNTQRIKSITIRYQCGSSDVYITSVKLCKVAGSIYELLESTGNLTSTSVTNFTMNATIPLEFNESDLYVRFDMKFNTTGAGSANVINIFRVIITTE